MISFNVDVGLLKKELKHMSNHDKKSIHEGIGFIIENNVVKQVDKMQLIDTGAFRSSINHNVVNEDHVIIQDGVYYGEFLEFGTREHEIPNAFGRGITVMHPGTSEYAPFRKGMYASEAEVYNFVIDKIIGGRT